jgi:hypothetical protein
MNQEPAAMIPSFYCTGVPADREVEVQVPPFDWGVANDDGGDIQQAFTITLSGGTSNRLPLDSQTVRTMPRSGTRIYRNWPGRPARVTVISVSASNAKLASDYGGRPGCYVPAALAGRVAFDPKPLAIRVDDGGKIAERVETDNELTR